MREREAICFLSCRHRIDGKNGFLTAVLRQKMAADASDLRVIHAHVVWQGNQSLSEILELIFLLTDPVRKRRDCDPFWAYMHFNHDQAVSSVFPLFSLALRRIRHFEKIPAETSEKKDGEEWNYPFPDKKC